MANDVYEGQQSVKVTFEPHQLKETGKIPVQ